MILVFILIQTLFPTLHESFILMDQLVVAAKVLTLLLFLLMVMILKLLAD
jgi:hypothetical protein